MYCEINIMVTQYKLLFNNVDMKPGLTVYNFFVHLKKIVLRKINTCVGPYVREYSRLGYFVFA